MTEKREPRFRHVVPSVASQMLQPSEPPLPSKLQEDWNDFEKLLRETDQAGLKTMCATLDAIYWAVLDAEDLDEAMTFVSRASFLAERSRT